MLQAPASLKVTLPLVLLGFAAALVAVNLGVYAPRAERVAEQGATQQLAQEMARLQSTLEYLLLKDDAATVQHEIAVLAHNHDVIEAVLLDDRSVVIAATRRAWLGRGAADVLDDRGAGGRPESASLAGAEAADAARGGARIERAADGALLRAEVAIRMPPSGNSLRATRSGRLHVAWDLLRARAQARTQVQQQSLFWAGWFAVLAAVLWAAFHFVLTRRTALLVRAAEQIAAGHLDARSALRGHDELARLSQAFDAMAAELAANQRRLEHDLAERARVQQALALSEASYRAMFDAAEDAIFVIDIDSARLVDANPKARAVYELTRAELPLVDLGRLRRSAGERHAERASASALDFLAAAGAGAVQHFEWERRDHHGNWHWDEVSMKRVSLGGRDRVLALTREITDRKRAEAALRASEEQYRTMFNAAIDGVALVDADGRIVDSNPALWRMVGYGDADSGVRAAAQPAFLRRVRSDAPSHQELRERHRDGHELQLEVHGIPMRYRERPHALVIARDITEKLRSAAELERQREGLHQRQKLAALGSLLAGVAHELNNPLSVVVARAVLLEEQGDAATRSAAAKIRNAAERCARIVRTFLAMARQQPPERAAVDINAVVRAALDLAAYATRNAGIELRLTLGAELPAILADEHQLHQVLLNLLINAQQALLTRSAPRRMQVATGVRAGAAGREVWITVSDNGPGVPADLRGRVFEPYFTTKPLGEGTGVGLAVSLGMIEAHGGTLTVQPADGGGARFTITLPAQAEVAQAAEAAPPRTPAGQALRVLVVDDEPEVSDALVQILQSCGHQVEAASGGGDALRWLGRCRFDLLLTDLHMPDLDGRALLQEVTLRWPRLAERVVFVTGATLDPALREFLSQSGRPVIEKPFLPADVRRVVSTLAGAGAGPREA